MIPFTLLVALSSLLRPSTAQSQDYCRSYLLEPQRLFADSLESCPRNSSGRGIDDKPLPGSPWSYKPYCVDGPQRQYCALTKKGFRGNRGLSVIAAPQAADAVIRAFEHARRAPSKSGYGSTYHVEDVPGRGKGTIATVPIKKGARIMLDSPSIIASSHLPAYVGPTEGVGLLKTAVERLSKRDRAMVTSLDKSSEEAGVDDILKTNSFACQIRDDGVDDAYLCLFANVSRINHACQPNAHARFIPKSLLMEIKALRDIKPGEEISISYGKIDLKHAERQRLYHDAWGFTCTCDLCSQDEYAIKGSDQRRTLFGRLKEKLDAITADTYDAQQILAWEKQVLEISDKEGFEVLVAEDYERLAYVHAGLGSTEEARSWAQKAKQVLVEWTMVDGAPDNDLRRVNELLGELGA